MGLDVYVMPLWRFKAGEFTSPIEATLGVKPITIAPGQRPKERLAPWYLRLLARIGVIELVPVSPEASPEDRRALAVQQVQSLKTRVTEITGTPVDWPDDGKVYYSEQFHDSGILKAFAAWCDHREELPDFLSTPERHYYSHPVWRLPEPSVRRFPTISQHSLFAGYLLPVEFAGIHLVEPFRSWGDREFFRDVASSHIMLKETDELLSFMETLSPPQEDEHDSSPVAVARRYAEQLQEMCRLSIAHRLPVIFYG
jgi:hypothetical protein